MQLKYKDFSYETGSIEVKNIFDPLIKLGAFFVLPLALVGIGVGAFKELWWLVIASLGFGGAFLVYCLWAYSYYSVKDRDRLQSEKYLLETQRLALDHKSKREIDITPAVQSLSAPDDSELPALSEGESDSKEDDSV